MSFEIDDVPTIFFSILTKMRDLKSPVAHFSYTSDTIVDIRMCKIHITQH